VSEVYIYSFFLEKLKDAWIFQIPQQAGAHYFVTEQCKKRMDEAGLTNFPLQLVWDSENPNYQNERYIPAVWEKLKLDYAIKKGLVAPSEPKVGHAPQNSVKVDVPDRDDLKDLENMAEYAIDIVNQQARIKLSPKSGSTLIVEHLQNVCEKLRRTRMTSEEQENRVIEMGILWGKQV
jgi:hypothetical protein